MIKNKILYIKIIFKIYLKILKISLKYFRFSNKFLLYKKYQKIIFKNYFLKTIIKPTLNLWGDNFHLNATQILILGGIYL